MFSSLYTAARLSRHVVQSSVLKECMKAAIMPVPNVRPFSSNKLCFPALLQGPFGAMSTSLYQTKNHQQALAVNLFNISTRSFSNQKKKKKTGSKKRKERVAKNKDVAIKPMNSGPNEQNEEWMNFQRSISVKGFNTGQVTTFSSATRGTKNRGGSGLRRRKLKEMEMQSAETASISSDAGTGQFPALRYSDEETQRLLSEAYASIPKRTGKRGTRNLKRQERRWDIVRKNRAIKKDELIRAHFRRMEKRGQTVKQVLAVKAGADKIRAADKEYQEQVLKKWAEIMKSSIKSNI